MTRHWWIFDIVFVLACIAVCVWLYGCTGFEVGIKKAPPQIMPTTRPYVEIQTGDQAGDPWLSYALVAAVVVVALCSPPPCWLWRRRRRRL